MSAAVVRFDGVTEQGEGARIRARRKSLALTATKLAELAGVSREHLSEVETGRKEPSEEWRRRVEIALEREEGRSDKVTEVKPGVVRVEVQGVYGAKALIFEADPSNPVAMSEMKSMIDQIMRSLRDGESE